MVKLLLGRPRLRGHEFKNEGFGPGTVILCDQEVPKEKWFCHPDCPRIHSALQKLVVHGQQKLPESLLNVLRKKNNEKGPAYIKWRVLSGKTSTDEVMIKV